MHNPNRPFLIGQGPQLFKQNDWEIIEAVGPTYEYDEIVGYIRHPTKGPDSIYLNTLSLGPNTICVEAHEDAYIEQLDKLGIEVVPVPYDKVVPFGGSLHCTTVDVTREGELEDYFPKQITGF